MGNLPLWKQSTESSKLFIWTEYNFDTQKIPYYGWRPCVWWSKIWFNSIVNWQRKKISKILIKKEIFQIVLTNEILVIENVFQFSSNIILMEKTIFHFQLKMVLLFIFVKSIWIYYIFLVVWKSQFHVNANVISLL